MSKRPKARACRWLVRKRTWPCQHRFLAATTTALVESLFKKLHSNARSPAAFAMPSMPQLTARQLASVYDGNLGVLRGLRASAFRTYDRSHARATEPPGPHIAHEIERLDSLEEITHWLGTFSERLKIAREHERAQVAGVVRRLEARYKRRRAELA